MSLLIRLLSNCTINFFHPLSRIQLVLSVSRRPSLSSADLRLSTTGRRWSDRDTLICLFAFCDRSSRISEAVTPFRSWTGVGVHFPGLLRTDPASAILENHSVGNTVQISRWKVQDKKYDSQAMQNAGAKFRAIQSSLVSQSITPGHEVEVRPQGVKSGTVYHGTRSRGCRKPTWLSREDKGKDSEMRMVCFTRAFPKRLISSDEYCSEETHQQNEIPTPGNLTSLLSIRSVQYRSVSPVNFSLSCGYVPLVTSSTARAHASP